jgi:hypothetical protein
MANITEIPELVKITYSLFGEKWGKRLGRAIVILFLVALAGAAVTAVMTAIGHVPTDVLFSILSMILILIAILGIPVAIAILIGWTIRVGFATPTNIRIDNTLNKLLPLLRKANRGKLDKETIKRLLEDTEKLEAQWNKSKIVKFIHRFSKPKSKKGQGGELRT